MPLSHPPETQFVPLSDPLWVQSLGEDGYKELQHYWGKGKGEGEGKGKGKGEGKGEGKSESSEVPLLPLVARLKGYEETAHYRTYAEGGRGKDGTGTGSGTGRGGGVGGGDEKEGMGGAKGEGGGATKGVAGRTEAAFRPFTVDDCKVSGTVG